MRWLCTLPSASRLGMGTSPSPRAVGDDHDVGAGAHGVLDLVVERIERRLEGALAGVTAIGGVEDLRAEAHAVDGADAPERVMGEQRALQAHEATGVAAVLEQVAVVAEVEHRARDEALAQRVDGRVRHLGEQLVEVVKEAARFLGEHGERRVDAHGGQRHLRRGGHGAHGLVNVVVVVAVAGEALREREPLVGLGRQLGGLGLAQVADVERLVAEPVAVGLLVGVLVADLVVPQHAALRGVHLEHLARAQAARAQDVLGLHVDGAHLGGQDEAVVARDVVARGTQAVAVERRPQDATVRERDGGRAVPGLHEHGLVGVVGAALPGQVGVVVPRLGDHERHGAVEGSAVHREELEHVVEDGGVGAFLVDDGQHGFQVLAQNRRVQVGFAGANPVHVALQRVDLAVMDDVTVRVSALPGGGGVGGVARMHQRDCGFHGSIGKVDVEAAHLRCHQHALVHDGAGAEGAYVEDVAVQRVLGVGGLLHHAAAYVQAALERIAALNVFRASYECLKDGGHAGACG